MVGFLVAKRLSAEEAKRVIEGIEEWFKDNPRRRICRTPVFKVRRGHVVEDVLIHSEKGLNEPYTMETRELEQPT